MKVKEKLIELGTNVFNGIKAEARLIGRAFNRSVRVVPETPPSLSAISTPTKIYLKQRDGNVLYNGQVVFDRPAVEGILVRQIEGGEDLWVDTLKNKKLVCRHMVDLELRRRVQEDSTPGMRTKESRNELFAVKNIPTLQKMLLPLSASVMELRLNAPSVYVFKEEQFGQCIADRLREMGENTAQHFVFSVGYHIVELTIKHKTAGYSMTVWDPNYVDRHLKAKLASPDDAKQLQLRDFFMTERDLELYTLENDKFDNLFWLYALPHGWPNEVRHAPTKTHFTEYHTGDRFTMSRAEVIKFYEEI